MNDGSTDRTQDLLSEVKQKCDNVAVLNLEKNVGKAEAVRMGVKQVSQLVSSDYIGYIDADLATPLSFVAVMENEFKNSSAVDFVFGSRLLADKNVIKRRTFRHLAGRWVSKRINKALGKKFGDTQCGAKLMKSNIAAEVFHESFKSTWLFDVEIIKRLLVRGNQNIREIPVNQWKDIGNSKVSKWYFFKMLGELRKISKIK